MPVVKITVQQARTLHANYLTNAGGGAGVVTQAVIFDFVELEDAIRQAFDSPIANFVLEDPAYGFIAYYGRYPSTEPTGMANRNTLIIQFLRRVGTEWQAIADEIYNFGDLKPPKTILDEQVIVVPVP